MPCDSCTYWPFGKVLLGELDPSKEWGCFVSLSQGPSHSPPPRWLPSILWWFACSVSFQASSSSSPCPHYFCWGPLEMCCLGWGKEDVASFLYKGGWGACLPACLPTRPIAIYPVLEELTEEFRVTRGWGAFQGQRDGALLLMAFLHSSSPWGLLGFLFLESQCWSDL